MPQELDYSILNIDYNNIHNAEELQKIIHQLKAIIQYKIKHINELSSIQDKELEEREIVLRRMSETNSLNSHKIEEYKNLIYSISEDYSRFIKQSQQEKEKLRKSIETIHQSESLEINKKIQQFETEYKKLKQFQDLEAQYIAKIDSISKESINQQYEQNDGLNKEEAFQMKQNRQLQARLDHQLNITYKTAPSYAVNKIAAQLQTNQQQNFQLKQKLHQLQSQLQKLKKERNQIVNKRKQLKINVTLNQEELEQYKAVGSLQKAKIKAYKDKLENLKNAISEEVSKKQKTLAEHKKEREANLKTLKLKLFNFQKQKEQLKIKTQKINLLGQTILQQRTQIEEFFIMALESCKRQIQEIQRGKQVNSQQKQQKNYGDKVDIEELLPKDKQRILTNLYTKLAFGMK